MLVGIRTITRICSAADLDFVHEFVFRSTNPLVLITMRPSQVSRSIVIQTSLGILENRISRYGLFVPFPRQTLRRPFRRSPPRRTLPILFLKLLPSSYETYFQATRQPNSFPSNTISHLLASGCPNVPIILQILAVPNQSTSHPLYHILQTALKVKHNSAVSFVNPKTTNPRLSLDHLNGSQGTSRGLLRCSNSMPIAIPLAPIVSVLG